MQHYKPLTEELANGYMKDALRLNKHERSKRRPLEVLGMFKEAIALLMTGFERGIFAEEEAWRTAGRHVIILDDPAVAGLIADLTFRLDVVDGIAESAPLRFFRVSLPNRFTVGGRSIPPMNVALYAIEHELNALYDPLRQVGLTMGEVKAKDLYPGEYSSYYLSVVYPIMSSTKGERGRVTVPLTRLRKVLSATHIHDALPRQGVMLNAEEEAEQLAVLQFVVRLILFTIARPDALSKALPGKAASLLDRSPESHYKITFDEAGSLDRSAHYRRGFLRQLRAERYYQKPQWINSPRGSRFVFVSDTTVGEDELHFISDDAQ